MTLAVVDARKPTGVGLLESVGLQADVDIAIEVLPLAELFIDDRFQRGLDTRRVEAIVGAYDPKMIGVPVVNRRGEGHYSVCDGQHRVAALRMLDRKYAVCQVVGIPEQQEALLFVDLQHRRRDISALERHKALIFARVDEALAIERIVKAEGFKLSTFTPGAGVIAAVKALYAEAFGNKITAFPVGSAQFAPRPDSLRFALRTIRESWGIEADPISRSAPMIRGLSTMHHSVGDALDENRLFDQLSSLRGGPRALANRARGRGEYERGSIPTLIGREAVTVYNGGLRQSKRTPRIDPLMIGRSAS